jgi:serine/threonine-protein kinase
MIGNQVSHYTLSRKLGAGTYGEVYEGVHAHDPELKVAVKIVARALVDDARFVDALKKECRQLDRMDHPNIVRFRELVVTDAGVAMVLELLDGQDLHARLAGGPLPVDTAVAVVEAVLEGLAYAHARGVMHRDIKPSNAYWCDDGRIKLLDFGIARAADGTAATKTGHMVGTLDYMAPERFDDRGGSMASDVYAVGLIAWELLAGRAACPDGEFGRKLGWHLAQGVGDAARVRSALPACPPWFAEVIATLAAKAPEERPADGAAALALLRAKRPAEGGIEGAPRAPPPATVMGPAPVGTVPPVGASVPPRSVPPPSASTGGRGKPPETVFVGAGVAPESAAQTLRPHITPLQNSAGNSAALSTQGIKQNTTAGLTGHGEASSLSTDTHTAVTSGTPTNVYAVLLVFQPLVSFILVTGLEMDPLALLSLNVVTVLALSHLDARACQLSGRPGVDFGAFGFLVPVYLYKRSTWLGYGGWMWVVWVMNFAVSVLL